MAPDYYFFQPQLGYNELEWSKIKMAHLDKGLYSALIVFLRKMSRVNCLKC